MKIALAQIQPVKAEIENNLKRHILFAHKAAALGADLVVFPELSISGYEPELVADLALIPGDKIFEPLKETANKLGLIICASFPEKHSRGVTISNSYFKPKSAESIYAKQFLHKDELSYFTNGETQFFLQTEDEVIAPAICYESLRPEHLATAVESGATIYLANVAKPARGLEKAFAYFPKAAKANKLPILMVNSTGHCDNFLAEGMSAAWNSDGKLLAVLPRDREGVMIFDSANQSADIVYTADQLEIRV